MFLKRAIVQGSFYTGNQIESLKSIWPNIVKSRATIQPFEEFEWDPEHFLYYRARAITANVPNLNGDYFEDEELKKSYETFRGKGVYYNHDSDSPDKAFGIILDAVYHDFPDDKYVQILAAIDKEEIEKKRPGLLGRIMSGSLKTTSMSVLVQECICSLCGNVAHSPEELCEHMNPKSANYLKGKTFNGQKVYEINRGLTFIEDSIVDVPADPTAYIFQVYSSYDVNSPRLIEHFKKYSSFISQAKTEIKETTIDEMVDKMIENKFINRIKQVIEEQIRLRIDPILQKFEEKIVPQVTPVVEEKIDEKKEQLEIKDDLLKEQKIEEEEKKEIEENKEIEKKDELKKASSSEDLLLKDPKKKTVLIERPSIIDIGPYQLKLKEDKYYVEKEGKQIGKIDIPKNFDKMTRNEKYKYLENKINELEKSEKSKSVSGGYVKMSKIQGKYIPGKNFDESFFIFSNEDNTIKVKASQLLPEDIQERILNNDSNIVTPNDIIDQIITMSEGSFEKLSKEVLPELIKQANFKKDAEWSWAVDEIPNVKVNTKEPIMSINKDEIMETKEETGPSVKVKQYFNRLPSKGVPEPTQTINVSSSIQDKLIKAKIELLKKALEEEKNKREKTEEELNNLKKEVEKKDKSEIIEKLVETISKVVTIDEENQEKVVELLNKFAIPQLNILNQLFEVLSAKPIEKSVDILAEKSLDKSIELPIEKLEKPEPKPQKKEASIPQIFISSENSELDIIEIARRSLEK